jgi:hypothetical protein
MISNVSGQANAGKTTTKGMPAASACAERSEKQKKRPWLLAAGANE